MSVPYFFHVTAHPDAGTLEITTDPVDSTETGSSVTIQLDSWGALIANIYSAVGESRPGEVDYLVKCMLDYRQGTQK